MFSGFGRKRPWIATASILAFASLLGCGSLYRPVVTSIPPVQPGPQPLEYAVVITCAVPNADASAPNIYQICANDNAPGKASLVDFSGDTLLARVDLGTGGSRWISLGSKGVTAYVSNNDGTLQSFIAENTNPPLENHSVQTSTLLADATPTTMLSTTKYLYVAQPGRSSIGVLDEAGTAPIAFLEVPIADPAAPGVPQNPVYLVGNLSTQRVYAISQGANSAATCPTSGPNGTATAIETSSNTVSARLPLGVCPVYGLMSLDNRRTFILNEGSGTVSVIDSEQNQIDPNFPNGIAVGQGPIWADLYKAGSILAVVNSRSNTLSLINVATDQFGHDGPNFGETIATIPVGNDPSSVSVLQDGTRAYVANRGDGTVSVVSLVSDTVTKTIPLPKEPCNPADPTVLCTVHPVSIAAATGTPRGKVYVVSPDTNILTIIRTDNDTIEHNLPLTGDGVQVVVTSP